MRERESLLGFAQSQALPATAEAVAPYPDSSDETLALVITTMRMGETVFFEGGSANPNPKLPVGFDWEILPSGLGSLTRN